MWRSVPVLLTSRCRLVLLSEWIFDGNAGLGTPYTWIQFRGFLCYYVMICAGLLTLAPLFALALQPALGLVLGGLVSGLLFSLLIARLSFVPLATALQLPTSFLESWNHTTGHGLKLWSVYATAAVPAAAMSVGLGLAYYRLPDVAVIQILLAFVTWCKWRWWLCLPASR